PPRLSPLPLHDALPIFTPQPYSHHPGRGRRPSAASPVGHRAASMRERVPSVMRMSALPDIATPIPTCSRWSRTQLSTAKASRSRSEEHTSELQSPYDLV